MEYKGIELKEGMYVRARDNRDDVTGTIISIDEPRFKIGETWFNTSWRSLEITFFKFEVGDKIIHESHGNGVVLKLPENGYTCYRCDYGDYQTMSAEERMVHRFDEGSLVHDSVYGKGQVVEQMFDYVKVKFAAGHTCSVPVRRIKTTEPEYKFNIGDTVVGGYSETEYTITDKIIKFGKIAYSVYHTNSPEKTGFIYESEVELKKDNIVGKRVKMSGSTSAPDGEGTVVANDGTRMPYGIEVTSVNKCKDSKHIGDAFWYYKDEVEFIGEPCVNKVIEIKSGDKLKFGNWSFEVCTREPRDGIDHGMCLEVTNVENESTFRIFEESNGWINTGDGKRTIYSSNLRE